VQRVQFTPPALSTLRSSPPTGEQWQYEVKFDGFRIQIHKLGLAVALFGNYAERTIMRSVPPLDLSPAHFSTTYTPDRNDGLVWPSSDSQRPALVIPSS
jgi:hypothetical protein